VSASLSSRGGRYIVIALVFLWTIPTFGLLVSSVRPEQEVKTSGWWEAFIRPKFTLSNYSSVLSSTPGSANLTQFFLNSVKITVPAVLLSVGIGAMAAYAFSWMKFKGRDWLFVAVVAMLVVPLQMALIPLLRLITGGAHIGSVTIFPYLHQQQRRCGLGPRVLRPAVLHLHPQELHLGVAQGDHRGGLRRRPVTSPCSPASWCRCPCRRCAAGDLPVHVDSTIC
jgi:hypothetical protein